MLACGSGVIKPNISTLMGQTYDEKRPGREQLRSAAFLWFYWWHQLLRRNRRMRIYHNLIRIEPGTPLQAQAVAEGLINADDPLLPTKTDEMLQMFYRRRPPGFFEWSYEVLTYLEKLYEKFRGEEGREA